jgi:hypothetical protein
MDAIDDDQQIINIFFFFSAHANGQLNRMMTTCFLVKTMQSSVIPPSMLNGRWKGPLTVLINSFD